MHVPNREFAEVDLRKVTEYLLDPAHPVGAGKAAFFLAHGFRIDRPQELVFELLAVVKGFEVVSISETRHGRKFVVDGAIRAPDGRSPSVRTVWAIDVGRLNPRLITAFPAPRFRSA